MFFVNEQEKRVCPNCRYVIIPPYPEKCPKCGALLNINNNSIKKVNENKNNKENNEYKQKNKKQNIDKKKEKKDSRNEKKEIKESRNKKKEKKELKNSKKEKKELKNSKKKKKELKNSKKEKKEIRNKRNENKPNYPLNMPELNASKLFSKHLTLQAHPEIVRSKVDEKQYSKEATTDLFGLHNLDSHDNRKENQILKKEINTIEKEKKRREQKFKENDKSKKIQKIQVKKTESKDIDLSLQKVKLGEDEYLRFIGITTESLNHLYWSNESYKYFLDLGGNVHYIASSILTGELDQMVLFPEEESDNTINNNLQKKTEPNNNLNNNIEQNKGYHKEYGFFSIKKPYILMVFGEFPEKKARWILNELKKAISEILPKFTLLQDKIINNEDFDKESPNSQKDMGEKEKLELFKFRNELTKRIYYIIREYLKLQEIFSPNKLPMIDDFLKIDYIGLSYQSIGVISKLITDDLNFSDQIPLGELDDESQQELKESLLTAKIQAIAANTLANTHMMPSWISVKLGFQQYRFILFAKQGDYYLSLLATGNLDFKDEIINPLFEIMEKVTKKPFIGNLAPYQSIEPEIIRFLEESNKKINTNKK